MHKIMNKIILLLLAFFITNSSQASSPRKIPRFVITKSDHVNARKGPGAIYPINWVIIRKSEPLKVIAEFDDWRKIEDKIGYAGWIHSSLLSPKRSVIITCKDQCNLYKNGDQSSKQIALLEEGLRCSFEKVKDAFAKVKCNRYKGWIGIENIWGLLDEERAG